MLLEVVHGLVTHILSGGILRGKKVMKMVQDDVGAFNNMRSANAQTCTNTWDG